MLSIGLTGNFGMGKSSVLRLFSKLGAYTFDSDGFVHEILEKPEMISMIAGVLGKSVLIKRSKKISLDKKLIADIIFNEPLKRKKIEGMIHPEVFRRIENTKSEIIRSEPSAIIIFEVPLLFESGYETNFDRTIVVYCNRRSVFRRLSKRGFSGDEIKRRVRVQMPITRKIKMADFVINNSNSLKKTELRVKRIFSKITN